MIKYISIALLIALFIAYCHQMKQQVKVAKASSVPGKCNSPQKITAIYKEYVYDLTGYEGITEGSAFNLFDENDYVDPKSNFGNPQTTPHPLKGAGIFFKDRGSRLVVDLRIPYKLSEVYLYDRAYTSDSVWIYTGTMRNLKLKAGFLTRGNPGFWGWRKFSVDDSTQFILFRFSSYEANITEAVLYGCPLAPIPDSPSKEYTGERLPPKMMKDFLGVNCYQGTPVQWMQPFYYSRVYTYNGSIDYDTLNPYPHNKYNITPHGWYNNGIQDYVLYVDSIKHFTRGQAWYSYLGVSAPLYYEGYDNYDRPVTTAGMDTEDPMSYARHANMLWTMAAAYGTTAVDTNRMRVNPIIGPRFSGRNVMTIYENGNESDAYWAGYKYCNPIEYFALSSADYDGHEGKMGSDHGIKNADKNSELMTSGFVTFHSNRLRILKFLCNTLRKDGQFLWQGGIQYHYYSTNGPGDYPGDIWTGATGGITPEEDSLRQKLARIRNDTYKIQPDVECFLGEYGYDKSRHSKVSAPLVPGYNQSESQGIMLIRAINAIAFSGFDRYIIYWIKDTEDENSPGLFLTSGILREHQPGSIYAPYPAWYYISTLVHHLGNYVPEKIISEKGNAWIYKYRNKLQPDSSAYFVYSPTRNGTKINDYELGVGSVATKKAVQVILQDKTTTGNISEKLITEGFIRVTVDEVPKLILLKEK